MMKWEILCLNWNPKSIGNISNVYKLSLHNAKRFKLEKPKRIRKFSRTSHFSNFFFTKLVHLKKKTQYKSERERNKIKENEEFKAEKLFKKI